MSFVDVAQDVAPMTRMKLVRRRLVSRAPEGKCAPTCTPLTENPADDLGFRRRVSSIGVRSRETRFFSMQHDGTSVERFL